jgi:hypothetical protein
METVIRICFVISFVSGLIYIIQGMIVLHTYEVQTKKRPPAVQVWPFTEEMKSIYPGQSKVGRVLAVSTAFFFLPWFVNWLIGGVE